ncbi:helix-turn-helix domain-containing protein [Thermococcus gammatolerans]|uniref:HTH bat-type domain-containing protein n=1 Tax=Thermococcus gammatolerans (strain DSM 15229 / JCM 11827 / EJ3) TaxID=593117 RepID=C5A524_THEGJ|nr:helix-turn-helix domain-containing protein [Thermococcus gammatolerans]ACS33336.1 Conserved hypothetical protein [Thermococcus gammatolerans EJ3]
MELVEWGYGDTYFFLGSDVMKLVEIKFKEEVNPEEITKRLLEIPHVKDAKLIGKQLETLLLAYKSGYFDSPGRVTLRDLAEMLNSAPQR